MNRIKLIAVVICFVVSMLSVLPAIGQDISLLTSYEMDELLGPIALYPDPLLAQILLASTFPDQLLQASHLIQLKGGAKLIDEQDWDVSVKALAHYPGIVEKMVKEYDWSDSIGQTYINQPEDVMKSIQRLRGRAKLLGYLSSNEKQEVITDTDAVRIIPAQAQYIYVPVYDPQVVYIERRPQYDAISFFISFGSGFSIGSWLNRDCDWHQHRVYYHGWQGNSWIQRSRQHIVVNNYIYVNDKYHNDDRKIDKHNDFIKHVKDADRPDVSKPKNKPNVDNNEHNSPDSTNHPRINDGRNNQFEPAKPDTSNTWNKQRVNVDRNNQIEPAKPDTSNSWNKQRVNADRTNRIEPVRPNTPNSSNQIKINNDRKNQAAPIKPDISKSSNSSRFNTDKKNQIEKVMQDRLNSQINKKNNK